MGQAKREWMRQQQEGWTSRGNNPVCHKCVSDEGIGRFIRKNASDKECFYCGTKYKSPRALKSDEVFSYISKCLSNEYESPDNNVGYDSSEGGYLITPWDSDEVFQDHELDRSHEGFWEDLVQAFSDSQWVKIDPYGMPLHEQMIYSWDAFSKQVRHDTRFVFYRTKTDLDSAMGSFNAEPHDVLEDIGNSIETLDMLTTLSKGSSIIRARQHLPTEQPKAVAAIGPLPAEKATQQNRFSPAGIPMFYGALDYTTAQLETVHNDPFRNHITFGTFKNTRSLLLLDLTSLRKMPSLFEEGLHELRIPIAFLSHFINEISKPVGRTGTESFEYVPTQIVAEYFRRVFRTELGKKLDGIKYRSTKVKGGQCVTLFLSDEDCGGRGAKNATLVLEKLETQRL